jgi:hypothetical protein
MRRVDTQALVWVFTGLLHRGVLFAAMHRRTYLTAIGTAGVVATAGCGMVSGEQTLSEPTVNAESPGRKALIFTANDAEVGHFGADGRVDAGRIELSTEIWHKKGTNVESIKLRVWMPETATDSAAEVAVVSPVEGDSSPPPSVALYTPERALGTVIEISDLDDLADETISTLDLIVTPAAGTASKLNIDVTLELTGNGIFDSDYTLDGVLELAYPDLTSR